MSVDTFCKCHSSRMSNNLLDGSFINAVFFHHGDCSVACTVWRPLNSNLFHDCGVITVFVVSIRERDDALNRVAEERQKTFMAKKNFREDINKINKKTSDKVLDMKNRMQFWQIVSIGTLIVGFLIGWIL